MPQPKPPAPPNPNKLYKQGIKNQLLYQPQLIAAEEAARTQYDPARVAEQQALQEKFGPTQYAQETTALHELDPTGTALREQMGNAVASDLALGSKLSPEQEEQLNSYVRGAQTSRGNYLGNAPISAEALYKGNAALALYQQRLQNAGNFLNSPTPEQQLALVQPVTPDRTSAYINPNAGQQAQQFGLQNYQNILAGYQLSGGGRNPWAGALGGAATGAAAGSSFGPYGAVAGGLIGGVGGYFSDRRLKDHIVKLYKDATGLTKKLFQYKDDPSGRHFVGYEAQEVQKKYPEHVGESEGFLTVSPEFAPIPV